MSCRFAVLTVLDLDVGNMNVKVCSTAAPCIRVGMLLHLAQSFQECQGTRQPHVDVHGKVDLNTRVRFYVSHEFTRLDTSWNQTTFILLRTFTYIRIYLYINRCVYICIHVRI